MSITIVLLYVKMCSTNTMYLISYNRALPGDHYTMPSEESLLWDTYSTNIYGYIATSELYLLETRFTT
jgi:hypothetical protein